MGRTLTTGGGAMTNMWRSVKDAGEAIEVEPDGLYKLVEPDPNEYCTPPRGTRARLRISGISETFEMPTYNDPDKMENKIRIEFLIENLSGNNIGWMKGKRFTQIMTERISAKSALGQLFATLGDHPIPANTDGFPFDGWIDTAFVSLIGENQSGTHAKVDPAGIEAGKTVLSPAVQSYFAGSAAPSNAREPEMAGVGAAAGGVDNDPFLTDDL